MRKQRRNIQLIGYDGTAKGSQFARDGNVKRVPVGRFKTIEEAWAAGATRFTPRYSRNS